MIFITNQLTKFRAKVTY